MGECYARMCEIRNDLSLSERKIVDVLIGDPKKTCLLSVTELADYCQTSPATITRMCKSLGYTGYREFAKAFILDASSKNDKDQIYDASLVENGDSIEDIANKVAQINISAIQNSAKIFDIDEIEKAVKLLTKAKKIHFYGIGGSSIAALDAEYRFLKMAKDAHAFTNFHEQIYAASSLTKNDVAVIISYSGETNEIIDVAKLCKKVHTNIVSITRYSNNSLSELADVKIKTTSIGNSLRSVSSGTQIAQLNMIDILYSAVALNNYDDLMKLHQMTNEIINKSKKSS